jgi:pantothenate kinase type III
MQGLITLDFGNSHPHAGLFQKNQNKWQHLKTIPFSELNLFLPQFQMDPVNSAIVLAEVKPREEELFDYLKQGFLLTRVKDYWRGNKFAGMPVDYAQTLGEDRLIEAYYLYKQEKTPTLLIDAGTFVTMDIINSDGFLGGYIFPSMTSYFETFKKGELLKEVALTPVTSGNLPHQTSEAMAGSYSAFVALAKSLIQKYSVSRVVVTGGNSSWWMQQLGQCGAGIHVKEEKDLIHFALHYWMTTQIEPI